MTPHPELTPDDVAELIGAFALDACTPEETAAIEAVLADHPDLAAEAARLTRAASWIGATETLVPPPSLRDRVDAFVETQRASRSPDAPLDAYRSLSEAMAAVIAELPEAALDEPTANGLTAHDLVVHMAAQESLLAHEAGVPVLPELDETDIDARTAALLPSFHDRPVGAAAELWQHAVETNRTWGRRQRPRQGHVAGHSHDARRCHRDPRVRDLDPHRRPPARRGLGPGGARAETAVGDV